MSTTLADALQDVPLEPGQLYTCRVGRLRVDVRVAEADASLPDPISPEDIRLDPWTDLPFPAPTFRVPVVQGGSFLPDPPVLPGDEEES